MAPRGTLGARYPGDRPGCPAAALGPGRDEGRPVVQHPVTRRPGRPHGWDGSRRPAVSRLTVWAAAALCRGPDDAAHGRRGTRARRRVDAADRRPDRRGRRGADHDHRARGHHRHVLVRPDQHRLHAGRRGRGAGRRPRGGPGAPGAGPGHRVPPAGRGRRGPTAPSSSRCATRSRRPPPGARAWSRPRPSCTTCGWAPSAARPHRPRRPTSSRPWRPGSTCRCRATPATTC